MRHQWTMYAALSSVVAAVSTVGVDTRVPTAHEHRVELFRSLPAKTRLHTRIWDPVDSTLRDRWAQPASPRLVRVYETMVDRAHLYDFKIEAPQLQQLPPFFSRIFNQLPEQVLGAYFDDHRSPRIILDAGTAARMNDIELSCLCAHELGHAIDHQIDRKDHPLTRPLDPVPGQLFAHLVGMYLCGHEHYIKFSDDWLLH